MFRFICLFVYLLSLHVSAKPSCLITKECFDYNGRIIDLRSEAAKMYQDSLGCDATRENCLAKRTNYETTMLSEDDFRKITKETGTEYFIPLDIREEDLKLLAGALSLGIVVFANDRALMDYVQEHKVPQLRPVVDFGNLLGLPGPHTVAAGSYFLGVVMKNGKMKQLGLLTLGSGVATAIVTEVFKLSFGRLRPNRTDSPYDFGEGGKSFFSGHTSASFSLATVVAEVYKDKPLIPYLAYGAASLTAYARMHDNKHWASDVLFGAVAGTLVTRMFLRSFGDDDSRIPPGLLIIPDIGRDIQGNIRYSVQVSWRPGTRKEGLKCSLLGLSGEALVRTCLEEALNQ